MRKVDLAGLILLAVVYVVVGVKLTEKVARETAPSKGVTVLFSNGDEDKPVSIVGLDRGEIHAEAHTSRSYEVKLKRPLGPDEEIVADSYAPLVAVLLPLKDPIVSEGQTVYAMQMSFGIVGSAKICLSVLNKKTGKKVESPDCIQVFVQDPDPLPKNHSIEEVGQVAHLFLQKI